MIKNRYEQRDKIVAILRVLPILPGREDKVFGFAVWIKAGWTMGWLSELQMSVQASKGQTIKELKTFNELTAQLCRHISHMHAPARELFDVAIEGAADTPKPPLIGILGSELRLVFGAAWDALHDHLETYEWQTRTKPEKRIAEAVTIATAEAYETLTGQAATVRTDISAGTAYGPFIDLLEQIFKVLGVEASAASQARKYRSRQMAKSRSNKGEITPLDASASDS